MTEWTKEKEKRILNKYRFTLTIKIIRTLAAILLIWTVYKIGISIAFDKTNASKKHSFYSNIALEWTNPNLSGGITPNEMSEITTLLTQKISYPVYRTIGKEQQYVGEKNLNKRLFSTFSTTELKTNQPLNEDLFHFYLPEDPKTGDKLPVSESDNVWNTLEKIADGTVADLAFSTKKYMNPKQLLSMISTLDVDVLWMPLYSGEFKSFDPDWAGGDGAISVSPFGLTSGKEISDDYLSLLAYSLTEEHIDESEKLMLKNIADLLTNERKGYYENLLGLYYLQERYDYLVDNGFAVYGAVVTGPVNELLKLRNIEEVRGAQLGKFEYWNWEN